MKVKGKQSKKNVYGVGKDNSFCNSHSVPRCVLDNIDTDGKVDYFNAIVNIPFINNDKGLNEAGTFKLLCPTCDGKYFKIMKI